VTTLPLRSWVCNAAAVFSGVYGAVTGQAKQLGCSRQTVYQHAREVEQRLDPTAGQAERDELLAEIQRLRDQLVALGRRSDQSVTCDPAKLREVATVAFAAGVSLRQIEDLFKALLPARLAPDHSTIGRWVAAEARKAKAILKPLDDACAKRVINLALDEIFFGGGRPWWGSSRRA
jgi:transposase-like protein